jgi:hypothetical protein
MRSGWPALIILLLCFACKNKPKEKKSLPERNAVHDSSGNTRLADTSNNGILKLIEEFEKGRGPH